MSGKTPNKFIAPDAGLTVSTTEILQGFGVEPHQWDVLIIGDGSGTTWNASCGWSAVLIDRVLKLRKDLHGGMNAGTSYLAEIIPYVQALTWYADGPGRARRHDLKAADPRACVQVHIVTDSEILTRQGELRANRRKGRPYWAMLEAIVQEGYALHWHWLARSTLGLNRLCDYLAGLCRKSMDAMVAATLPAGTSVYDFNPDT
jgi:ribonuclease HI